MTSDEELIEHFVKTIDSLVKDVEVLKWENKELKKEIEVYKNG